MRAFDVILLCFMENTLIHPENEINGDTARHRLFAPLGGGED